MTKISLCIPTKNRFDRFLSSSLDSYFRYLDNHLIDEIVLCDETGEDLVRIREKYHSRLEDPRVKLIQNDQILGVFFNKIKVCQHASHAFIALIDSDNFADDVYFTTIRKYIDSLSESTLQQKLLLAPCFAKSNLPPLDYRGFRHSIVTNNNIQQFLHKDNFDILLNTGNFVLSRSILDTIQLDHILDKDLIATCDVIYFILLCFQQFGQEIELHVVDGFEYYHAVHDDSECLKASGDSRHTLYHEIFPAWDRLLLPK